MSQNANIIKKGIVIIFLVNVLNMVAGIITNLILPKYLSIDTYADIKTFQLCLSYIGILHLGYNDGVYLEYGGKNISELNKDTLSKNATTIKFLEVTFFVVLLFVGFFLANKMIIYVAFVLVPYLLIAYYKYLFQACGEFSRYGRILNTVTVGLLAANMLLIILKIDDSSYYISAQILIYFFVWITLEVISKTKFGIRFKLAYFSFAELVRCIKQGILLMLGNFASTVITSMDRWLITFLMTSAEFAYYSFAVSLESFLNVATTPITTTLYNYFCKDSTEATVSKIRKYMVMFSGLLVSSAFAVKLLIMWYIPKYSQSTNLVFILFASQIFYILNRGIFTNLYKAKRKQNVYFIKLLITLVCAFALNVLFYLLMHSKEAFAIGTLISSIIWFVLVNSDFKEYRCTWKENLFMVVMTIALLLIGFKFNPIIGFLVYIVLCIILGHFLIPNALRGILYISKNYLKSISIRFKRVTNEHKETRL